MFAALSAVNVPGRCEPGIERDVIAGPPPRRPGGPRSGTAPRDRAWTAPRDRAPGPRPG